MKFSIRSLSIAVAVFATALPVYVALNNCQLWRDTILRSELSGVIIAPSGVRYKTNHWFTAGDSFSPGLLGTEDPDRYHLIFDDDTSQVARFEYNEKQYDFTITEFRERFGDNWRMTEFWVTIGGEVK